MGSVDFIANVIKTNKKPHNWRYLFYPPALVVVCQATKDATLFFDLISSLLLLATIVVLLYRVVVAFGYLWIFELNKALIVTISIFLIMLSFASAQEIVFTRIYVDLALFQEADFCTQKDPEMILERFRICRSRTFLDGSRDFVIYDKYRHNSNEDAVLKLKEETDLLKALNIDQQDIEYFLYVNNHFNYITTKPEKI